MYDRISDFYDGKSIFLTGATGYLGSVLLEIFLRCLPQIKHIYVLIRPKKGKGSQERKNILFQKEIFKNLLKKSPAITDKVKVVNGDVSQTHLGINEEDLLEIIHEVTIVIHCAGMVTFALPFRVCVQTNTLGTRRVTELCRKLKKCEILVYTSTAFSNVHLLPKKIEEKSYELPFSLEHVLTDLENKDDEWFLHFLSKYNCKWPNSYAFSKCLAENILNKEAADIPLVIIRPSIIFGTLKGPNLGYVERGAGIVDISLAIGTGICSIVPCDDIVLHIIPADIVANALIASTWLLVTNRYNSPFILNSTCGEFWNSKVPTILKQISNFFHKNTLPNSLQEPSLTCFKNRYLYKVFCIYADLIPSAVLDIVAYFKGDKFRLMPIQKQVEILISALIYFGSTHMTFGVEKFKNVSKQLHPEDREIFYTDLTGTKVEDIINNLLHSSTLYNWKKDKFSPKRRRHFVFVNTMIITFIRRISLIMIISLIYVIATKIFL